MRTRECPAVDDSAWEGMSETEREEHVLRTTPAFIHLRGAKVLYGNGTFVPANGTLWRGRLAQVDGWFLGTLGETLTSVGANLAP